jgi:hypothetical protein
MYTEQLTQALAQVDQIFPSNAAAGTVNSTGIDMQKNQRALWIIEIGAMTASSTVNIVLQSAANSNFNANVHNMTTNTNIAQVVNTSGGNLVVTVETSAEAVTNQNNGDRYARVQVVVGTAAVNYSVIGFGGEATHKPASAQNPAAVSAQYVAT